MPSTVELFATCAQVIPTVLLALVIDALGHIIETGVRDPRVRARWHRDHRTIFIVLTLNAALAEAACLLVLTGELPAPPTALRWYVAVSTIFLVATLCAALIRRMIILFRAAKREAMTGTASGDGSP